MATDERWYFTKEAIAYSPSRKCGIDAEKELSYRQQGAKLIQDMGQRLQVTQLVINTAIVYMHRFFMFHPFSRFHRNAIGPAALFLAAKVEEQPRKLEHVIKVAHYILNHHEQTNLDMQSDAYADKAQELVMNENVLLQTLGFDVAIDHPHTHVVKCFQMVRSACHSSAYEKQLETEENSKATTDLAQTSYFMATNSLHMTTMCLQYRPAVVACVCIFIVCKWSNYEIQRFTEGRDWFFHVDPSVNRNMLETLTSEFLAVLEKYPNRLKKIMTSGAPGGAAGLNEERARQNVPSIMPSRAGPSSAMRNHDAMSRATSSKGAGASSKTVLGYKEYSEKREKERRDREVKLSALGITPSNSSARSQNSENSLKRPPHSDISSRSQSAGSSRIVPPSLKPDPSSGHRRDIVNIRGDERTSDNNFDKLPSDKLKASVNDNRQFHNSDWPQQRISIDNALAKDKKIDVKKDYRDCKVGHVDAKMEPKVNDYVAPVKTEVKVKREFKEEPKAKHEIKEEPKVRHEIKEEPKVKPEIREETKVKEESRLELKPNNNFLPFHKAAFSFNDLKDLAHPPDLPPDDIFDNEGDNGRSTFESSYAPSPTMHRKLKSPSKSVPSFPSIQLSQSSRSSHDHPDSKSHKPSTNHPPVAEKISNGNSLPVPPKSSRKKVKSPHSASKSRHHNLFAEASQSEHPITKLPPKEPHPVKEPKPATVAPVINVSAPPSTDKAMVPQRSTFASPNKLNQEAVVCLDQTLKMRFVRNESCDAAALEPMKKHKHDYNSSHKHKDKKKKSKRKKEDKDKHKDREHKKNKKSKKSKDKEKPPKEELTPGLKITLVRDKGVYTPDAGPAVSRPLELSQAASSHSALDTPGRIKLTIPKSRLQSPESPPRGLPDKPKQHSRKRDRNSPPEPLPSKYARPHEVLDSSARWSSQRH